MLRRSRALFQPGDRVVVALSGGPDSSALLTALRTVCPLRLIAAHLDHGLRPPAETRRDRDTARDLAKDLGVPFESERVDVPALARQRGTGSLEAAARSARYRFLGEVADRHDASAIALGHTATDQVETVLMRALRGTGLKGLGGMPRKRRLSRKRPGIFVVRPLLSVSREEVLDYLEDRGIPSVLDSSNADPKFLRNRLRNTILPLLREQVNPGVDRALLRLAKQARSASRHLAVEVRALLEDAAGDEPETWEARVLRRADPAVRGQALADLVASYAPARAAARHVNALERLLAGDASAVELPGAVRLRVIGDRLERDHEPAPAVAQDLPLNVPGEVVDEAAQLRFEARVVEREGRELSVDPACVALLDATRARGTLRVRRRRAGDSFWPLGAPGHRSLKRFFIDQKVPRRTRDTIPVITLDDQPVWVVGHRIDEQYKVTPSTARVLELRAIAVRGKKGKRP